MISKRIYLRASVRDIEYAVRKIALPAASLAKMANGKKTHTYIIIISRALAFPRDAINPIL